MSEELPSGWATALLSDIVLPRETRNPSKEDGGTFEYVDIEALDNRYQIIVSPKTLKKADAPSRARVSIRPGDVLFSLVRPYLKNVAVVPEELETAVASTAYCPLRPTEAVDSRFLFYQVVQDSFIHSIPTYGNSPPAARDDEFLAMAVQIAPIDEQIRIVSKVEELFSKLDAGVAALQRVRENLKRYRASVLTAAVEGRLTAKWREENPSVEPASLLVERILQERRRKWEEDQLRKYETQGKTPPKGWKQKYNEPAKPDTDGLPGLPQGWCWASLDQLTTLVTSGSRGWAKYYSSDGPLFIRSQDISTDRLLFNAAAHVQPQDAEGKRTRVRRHDLLVTITGVNVTKTALVEIEIPEAYVNQHVALVRPVCQEMAVYLHTWVVCPGRGRGDLEKAAYGAGKPGLNLDNIRELRVAVPPLAEQASIVEAVERYLSVAAEIDVQTVRNVQRSGRLRQSILKRAFEGRLVPQDASDEPATVLLDRIRQQREADADSGRKDKKVARGKQGTRRPRKKTGTDDRGYRQLELPVAANPRKKTK